ncbi:Myb domain-contaning protein, partial [Globisporangium splendens]
MSGMKPTTNELRKLKLEQHGGDEEQRQPNVSESKFQDSDNDDENDSEGAEHETSDGDDGGYGQGDDDEDEFVLDRKHLLIVKDGTIRVAESLEQQQFDANGEAIKASGTWTKAEHDRFLKAIETYPKGPWKAIAAIVGSRTVRQTQTHAQKYREKMARRMRGLRNRNGTLQYPPASNAAAAGGAAMYSGPPAFDHDRMAYQQQQQYHPDMHLAHHHHFQQPMAMGLPPLGSAVHPHHPGVPASSMEFNQLSASSISSAFLGNPSYPASWDPNQVATPRGSGKTPGVPDFDESMDFLMNVYSSDPSQLGNTAADEQTFFKRE